MAWRRRATKERMAKSAHRLTWAVFSVSIPVVLALLYFTTASSLFSALALLAGNMANWVAFCVFLASSSAGYVHDINIQVRIYPDKHGSGNMPGTAVAYAVFLVAQFGLFAWFINNSWQVLMALALSATVIANAFGWAFMITKVIKEQTQRLAEQAVTAKNHLHQIRLHAWIDYIYGNWQVVRLVLGLALSLIFLAISITPAWHTWLDQKINEFAGAPTAQGRPPGSLSFFTIFVFFYETWIWIKRREMDAYLDVTDVLTERNCPVEWNCSDSELTDTVDSFDYPKMTQWFINTLERIGIL